MCPIPRADFTVSHRFNTINLINVPLRNNLVSTNLRPNASPQKPVEGTGEKHTDTNDGENKIRIPLGILHAVGGDEGHNGQEEVGSEVEKNDGKEGVPGGRPVLALLVLEIDETSSDEPVDPCAGVGVEIDDEVVGAASRGRHKDDDSHHPVEEEGSSGGVEGFGGGPESAEREKSLLTELLVKTAVCKTNRKHVSQITEGDKDGESACTGTITENIAEEETGNDDLRVGEVFFGDYGEVSDVGKNVQDRHTTNCNRCGDPEGPARILEFSEDVVGIFPPKGY